MSKKKPKKIPEYETPKSYEECFSYASLYESYRRCRLSKRDKREVLLFEKDFSKNLCALYYDLHYRRYELSGYHEFRIYDPKERVIQAISFRDRIVQHALVDNYLMPLLRRQFVFDNVACQKGKGVYFAHRRMKLFLEEIKKYENPQQGYFVKADVHKFFESIDHMVLKEKLFRLVKDKDIYDLLVKIIDSFHKETDKGLPMGNQSSQCFALLYLSSLDHLLKEKEKVRFYLRYMDDMILFVDSKEEARKCLSLIESELENVRLSLNPKSTIYPFKEGFEMIGWRYRIRKNKTRVRLRRSSSKRIRLKRKQGLSLESLKSYYGFLTMEKTPSLLKKEIREEI